MTVSCGTLTSFLRSFVYRTPQGNHDYALEVFRAMEDVWDGTGMFVFTSSGSVYAETKGGVVTEDSMIDERKVDGPLRSECWRERKNVRREGGNACVLYSAEKGRPRRRQTRAHTQTQMWTDCFDFRGRILRSRRSRQTDALFDVFFRCVRYGGSLFLSAVVFRFSYET